MTFSAVSLGNNVPDSVNSDVRLPFNNSTISDEYLSLERYYIKH